MISTRDLLVFPHANQLKALTQSLAMLDAILSSDWQYRYWSFDAHWGVGKSIASMRNGSGDELFAMFGKSGAILKGFAHESPMSPYAKTPPAVWPGVLDDVPTTFADFLSEPSFSPSHTTFCIWCTSDDNAWQCGIIDFPEGKDPDGSAALLALLDGNPSTYQTWAESYYERPVNLIAVRQVYEHKPLTNELIAQLNSTVTMDMLTQDLVKIGYAQ